VIGTASIDSSHVKAHRSAAGGNGRSRAQVASSRRRLCVMEACRDDAFPLLRLSDWFVFGLRIHLLGL